MKLTVNVLKLGTPSKTGRIYTKEVIEEAIQKFNENKTKFGVLGQDGIGQAQPYINLGEISHKVENLRIEEDYVKADIEPLDTPYGKTLQTLLENTKLAMAPRMLLDIQEQKDSEGNTIINEDGNPKTYIASAEIISVDIVQNNQRAFEENTIEIGEN